MKKCIDEDILTFILFIFISLGFLIVFIVVSSYIEKKEYSNPRKFEYSKYYKETLYEHICNYSNTLRIEIENGNSGIFSIHKKIYKNNNNFNIRTMPVARPRWYTEKLMNRGNIKTSSSSDYELKIFLYIDEQLYFRLNERRFKKVIKNKKLLTKEFICNTDFYKKYIEDREYYSDKIIHYISNKSTIVSNLYGDYSNYDEDVTDTKYSKLNKYRNDMWNIIIYER